MSPCLDEVSLFLGIVERMPEEVEAFFRSFDAARETGTLVPEIAALNVASADLHNIYGRRESGELLFRWYEVFRDIYIASRIRREKSAQGTGREKRPDDFVTFARTFEPLAMLPDFWFANDRLATGREPTFDGLFKDVYGIRYSVERALYHRCGGRAWGAMDWEMGRYVDERIFRELRLGERGPLRRLAALALTIREIANGYFGLFITDHEDVSLPLTGLTNSSAKGSPFLKYYHFDRYTHLSFAREHEFRHDVNFHGNSVRFEENWMALSVLSDFILKEADAHSTLVTARGVIFDSAMRCLRDVRSKTSDYPGVRRAVENLCDLLGDEDPAEFGRRSQGEILEILGVKGEPIAADYYLTRAGIAEPDQFWQAGLKIFHELVLARNDARNRTIPLYTQSQREANYRDADSERTCLRNALEYGNTDELPGMCTDRKALRNELRTCLTEGADTRYELQYGTVADVMLDDGPSFAGRRIGIRMGGARPTGELPERLLFVGHERSLFRKWIAQMWTELAPKSTLHIVADVRHRASGGFNAKKSESERKAKEKALHCDYTQFDFKAILGAADRLWDFYFIEDELCYQRWAVSVDTANQVIEKLSKSHLKSIKVGEGLLGNRGEKGFLPLQNDLYNERKALETQGRWPVDIERVRERIRRGKPVSLEDVDAQSRYFVILTVYAHLIVASLVPGDPELERIWTDRDFRFVIFYHIITLGSRDADFPYPWHVGRFSESHRRVVRTRERSINRVDYIVDGRLIDEAERQLLLMYVAHYLKQQERPVALVDRMIEIPYLRELFGEPRLSFLRTYFQ